MYKGKRDFGTKFERYITALLAILSGIILVFLSVKGPLVLDEISFKTHPLILNQLIGQDIINLFPLSFLLIAGGTLLLFRMDIARYFLISTPLFLFYYALSYMMGWEWMAADYYGNSYKYFFHYLAILISGLVIMLYTLSTFPKERKAVFGKTGLSIYSALMALFLSIFAYMWISQVVEVINTGTTKGYDIAPAAFWLIRTIDLGFCIPLGFISVYLLWTRPKQAFAIQFLFYGFFVNQILAVSAMGLVMYTNKDPNISLGELVFFLALGVLLLIGFYYIIRGYFPREKKR